MQWVRRTGIWSAGLGMFGLLSTFFWTSITFVYFGLLLLMLDLLLEPLSKAVKTAGYIVLSLTLIAFTYFIVLRSDPIHLGYIDNSDGSVSIYLVNATDTDYKDFDVHLQLPPDTFVVSADQQSALSSCSIFNFVDASAIKGETNYSRTDTLPSGEHVMNVFGNYKRVRCEALPHRSKLWIRMFSGKVGETILEPNRSPVTDIRVVGSYQGKFREFGIDERIAPQNIDARANGWKSR